MAGSPPQLTENTSSPNCRARHSAWYSFNNTSAALEDTLSFSHTALVNSVSEASCASTQRYATLRSWLLRLAGMDRGNAYRAA